MRSSARTICLFDSGQLGQSPGRDADTAWQLLHLYAPWSSSPPRDCWCCLGPLSRNRAVRNTRRDSQGVESSSVPCRIAFPGPSNEHSVIEPKETANPPTYLRLEPATLRMPDRSSGSFFSHRPSCCLARRSSGCSNPGFPYGTGTCRGLMQNLTLPAFIIKIGVPVEPNARQWRLAIVRGEQMQEFAWPGRTAETELAFDLEKAALRREFEQRLGECGTLAFRVARGVLRNVADAEDVAQEAILRSYRRFARLRDPSRFRAWLVRIAFRLALDHERSARRREHRETEWANGQPKATVKDIASSNEFGRRLQE